MAEKARQPVKQIDSNMFRIDRIDQPQLPDGVVDKHTYQKGGAFINNVVNDCENGKLIKICVTDRLSRHE